MVSSCWHLWFKRNCINDVIATVLWLPKALLLLLAPQIYIV